MAKGIRIPDNDGRLWCFKTTDDGSTFVTVSATPDACSAQVANFHSGGTVEWFVPATEDGRARLLDAVELMEGTRSGFITAVHAVGERFNVVGRPFTPGSDIIYTFVENA